MKKILLSVILLSSTALVYADDPNANLKDANKAAQEACQSQGGKNAVMTGVTISYGSGENKETRGATYTGGIGVGGTGSVGTSTKAEVEGKLSGSRTSSQENQSNNSSTQTQYQYKCE